MKRRFLKLLKSLKYFNNRFSEVRKIMGENFISPAEISKVTKLSYKKEQLRSLRKKLPSKKVLERLKENNFFLVPAPSYDLSLKKMSYYFPNFLKNKKIWERDSFFKNDKVFSGGWIFLSKDYCFDMGKNVPNVPEIFWLIIVLKLTRNINFVDNIFLSTSSRTSTRIVPKRVAIGSMPIEGLILAIDDYSGKTVKFFKIK